MCIYLQMNTYMHMNKIIIIIIALKKRDIAHLHQM